MSNDTRPVIFLAFANDRSKEGSYLRNLPEEARQVQAALDAAAQAGLCEVITHQNVTVDTVLDVFQDARYRNRIAVFHYGGHAESYELLLETAKGKTATADAGGLAAFLSRQTGLQLVFLNGCSTQPQVQGLLDAGVAAVIATAQAVDDLVATEFAVRFYKGLAGGGTVGSAFHEAEAACRTTHGNQPRSVFVKQVIASPAGEAMADRWPWALTCRPGSELVREWNLPDAANDPLFGLPPLPTLDLPTEPFRNILWFRREDAPIFFGRGYAIRELFQRVTAPDAAPVVLYYGQSGVGKSSLLAAGLLPRLEQVQMVVYARRDQALGLAGTLAANLPGSSKAAGKVPAADLLSAWCVAEADNGKPLTVLLDQAEEVYTRPNETLPGEMADFLDTLAALFGDPSTRPQGKFILGFRKEWLAEIEKLAAERQLQHAKVFLKKLDRRGIVEAVTGPAKSERLRQHYGLTVEDGLAGEIADDLLADPSSAVAPTLQILLSKLWKQAKARDYDHPHFDRDLYHDLRRQGLLLGDFLDQQMAALHSTQSAAVDSGLALDLLAFHTTPLGTAEQHTLAELRATYAHQAMALDGLVAACRDLYLLVDPAENRPDAEPASRLAHDTLAPLIRQRFEESDAPGQRARRILDRRASNSITVVPADPLGKTDLGIVEAGRSGMRTWQEAEKKYVDLSRNLHEKQRKRDQQIRNVLATLMALVCIIAGIALLQWRTARDEANNARSALVEAGKASRRSQAGELAAQVHVELATSNYDPSLVLLLAQQAVRSTWPTDHYVSEKADRALRDAIAEVPRWHLILPLHRHEYPVWYAEYSPDGKRIVTTGDDQTARIWDIATGIETQALTGHTDRVWSATYSQDGRLIVTCSLDQTARIWDASTGNALRILSGHTGSVNSATFSPDGQFIVTSSDDHSARIWSVPTGRHIQTLIGHTGQVRSADYSPDGRLIVTASYDGTARIWNISTGQKIRVLSNQYGSITSAAFSPDGRFIVTTGAGNSVAYVWEVATGMEVRAIVGDREVMASRYGSAVYSPDGQFIVTTSVDTEAHIWDVMTGQLVHTLDGHGASVRSAVYSPDGQFVVTSSADHSVRIWSADTGREARSLTGHTGDINSVAVSPDGLQAITGGFDGSARIWDITDGREIGALALHGASIKSVAYSPDGTFAVTASSDGSAHIWNVPTAKEIRVLSGHSGVVTTAAFSPDGLSIVTASRDGSVRIWDALSGREVRTLTRHASWVHSAAYSPDGQFIVTANSDNTARIWDALTGTEVKTLTGHASWVSSATYSPDGQFIVTASGDNTVRIWDVLTGTELQILSGHQDRVWSAKYSQDGKSIVTASADNTARVWNAMNGQEISVLRGHTGSVNSAVFSPSGEYIITASDDQTTRVWLTDTGSRMDLIEPHHGAILSVAYSRDGKLIATGGEDGLVQVWDARTRSRLLTLTGHDGSIVSTTFSPDGEYIATASNDGTARIWKAVTGQIVQTLLGHNDWVGSIVYSPDGQSVVTTGSGGAVRIWNVSSGQNIRTVTEHASWIGSAIYSPDGQFIAAEVDGAINIWDVASEEVVDTIAANTRLTRPDYSSDGKLIAAVGEDHVVHIWDAATRKEVSVLVGHTDSINDVAFSGDGKFIATASTDGSARIWDIATGQTVRTLTGHTKWVGSIVYSPDGQFLVTAGGDGTVRIWVTGIDDLLAESTRLIQRDPPLLMPDERQRYCSSNCAQEPAAGSLEPLSKPVH